LWKIANPPASAVRPRAGLLFSAVAKKRENKFMLRAICFFDGQNLYHAARTAFGIPYPSYDPKALSRWVCDKYKWQLVETRFYTGLHPQDVHADWHKFWRRKIARMKNFGVITWTSSTKKQYVDINVPHVGVMKLPVRKEKGVDVRIAVDVTVLALKDKLDVAVIFSQDSDFLYLVECADEIGAEQQRRILIASAFPSTGKEHGIGGTKFIPIDRDIYEFCQERAAEMDYSMIRTGSFIRRRELP
jgi:uncharacterized LabA/DUF88 family protein